MIERLHVSQLRNIRQATLSMSKCNVIIGANGSGKTSLLEAIFLLSRGKSFRHHQPKRYIQHHQPTATVHASLSDGSTLAIQKNTDASTLLRLNHNTVYNQSILTEQLPTLLIDPSSMDMLEQGSASRRQLLDWLAFHMKQAFHPQWVAYQRLLKQRNSVLKRSRSLNANQLAELQAWDAGLSNHAALIHHYRQHLFDAWQPYFAEAIDKLLPAYSGQLQLSYQAGFDTSRPLDEQLSERLEQDSQLGYTRIGSHRADIHVHWRSSDGAASNIKEQAANVLSRGEKKLLITALRLSQLPLLLNHAAHDERYANTRARPTPVVLLDDVTAELDTRAIDILLTTLAELPCQVVLTSLTQEILPQVQRYWQMPMLFHVKQGIIKHTDKPTESTAFS